MSERIEMIRRLLAEKGEDTFLVYSLGMELAAAGSYDQAVRQFRRCIELDESYLPAYAEAGKALRSAGRLVEARQMFSQAMDLAARQGETHMRDFLQGQLDALPPRP